MRKKSSKISYKNKESKDYRYQFYCSSKQGWHQRGAGGLQPPRLGTLAEPWTLIIFGIYTRCQQIDVLK